jgi:predicted MFS family arabinose efflux permease
LRLPESLEVLGQRDFRALFWAHAVSMLGDRMVAVALAFAVLEVGGSVSEVGLVLAARTLPMVASVLVGGVVADRMSRRALMVAADLVRFATQATLAVLLLTGSAEVWSLAALSGLGGVATGFFNPASTGLLPAVVAPERLQQANGLRATAASAGEIAGPALAGVLVAAAGAGWALAVDAATFAISAAFLVRLRLPPRAVAARSATFLADLREGWGEFRARTWVWTVVLSAALGNMLWGAWSVLGPVVAHRDLGGAAAWGTVLAALGVGALAGGVLATRARPRRPLLLVTAMWGVMGLPLAFLAAGAPVSLLAAAALVSGAGMMLANSLWESTLQRLVPAHSLSRVSAYDWFGSLAFAPLGMAIWGPISEAVGISSALWIAFALQFLTVLALFAVRDVRRLTLP